jgi:hypothetical protein
MSDHNQRVFEQIRARRIGAILSAALGRQPTNAEISAATDAEEKHSAERGGVGDLG